MNLVARQDRVLLGGLAVALIAVFARPIRYLLDLAREVEHSSGLALVPALIILIAVFLFHQQGRLVTFDQALGRSLEDAQRVADTLRRKLADLPVIWKGETVAVTASFGVSVALPAEIDSQALIGRADAAQYRAIDQGRNCVKLSMETAVVA